MNKAKWNKLLSTACSSNGEAQWEVGMYYEEGLKDSRGETIIRKNPATAVAWYRRAAENGSTSGQVALGVCLSSGIGVPKDDKEAIYWTKKAIQSGDESAAHNLATIYRDQENYKKAFFWFKRAVEMGDDDSLCELGQYYYFGLGVRRSPERAVQCFKKLIKIKWPKVTEISRQVAMYWLGIAHLQGQGVPQSVKRAKALFNTANKDGDHPPSHEMLLILGVEYKSNNKKRMNS